MEHLVEPEAGHLIGAGAEPFPPDPQRLRVVDAEVVPGGDPQPGGLRQAVLDRGDRREQAAGEDVLLDPGVGVPGGQHPVVRHGDGLQPDPPARRQVRIQGGEVGVPVALADRLEHLDRADRVELAVDVAVVTQFHADLAGQPGLGHPAGGQRLLLPRDRDGAHPRAAARGPDGQLAPAGADLEHPAAGPHPGPVEQPVDLAALRLGEQVVSRDRSAIGLGPKSAEE